METMMMIIPEGGVWNIKRRFQESRYQVTEYSITKNEILIGGKKDDNNRKEIIKFIKQVQFSHEESCHTPFDWQVDIRGFNMRDADTFNFRLGSFFFFFFFFSFLPEFSLFPPSD